MLGSTAEQANFLEDLEKTHSRYFIKPENNNSTGALLAVGLIGLAAITT